MGRLERRLGHLEEEHGLVSGVLICPECDEEFVVYGDAPLEFLVAEWARKTGQMSHRETPEDIGALFEHEHDPGAFVEKSSGLSFLSKAVSGINLLRPPERSR